MHTAAICNECWVLISFGDICGPPCHYCCICGYTLTIPPPHTLPYYPRTKHPPHPLSQLQTIWLGLPPSIIMGARRRNLRLAHDSAESVCLRAHCYLHHAPPNPHTRPRTLIISLYATTLHSHLLSTHTVAPHTHPYFDYKIVYCLHVPLGLASVFAKNRATLHIHSTHSINTRKHPTCVSEAAFQTQHIP